MIRRLYHADLVLASALHVGSPDAADAGHATPCRVDADGVPYIPGASLAGRLLETMRQLFADFVDEVDDHEHLTRKYHGAGEGASRMEVRTAYPLLGDRLASSPDDGRMLLPAAPRDRVAIDPATGAAEENKKFAQVEVPAGTRFRLLVELDLDAWGDAALDDQTSARLETWIATALAQWTRLGRVGGSSGAGCGWFRLEGLTSIEIDADGLDGYLAWDDPRLPPASSRKPVDVAALLREVEVGRRPVAFPIAIQPGPRANGYGWDSLLVGGGDYWDIERDQKNAFLRRTVFGKHAAQRYVPGSSVKGAVRGLLRTLAMPDVVNVLFGSAAGSDTERAGAALFGDLAGPFDPTDEEAKKRARERVLNRHAEDEFTAGVLGSRLFSEEPAFDERFSGWVVCETPDSEARELFKELRNALAACAEARVLALGSGGSTCAGEIGEITEDFQLEETA